MFVVLNVRVVIVEVVIVVTAWFGREKYGRGNRRRRKKSTLPSRCQLPNAIHSAIHTPQSHSFSHLYSPIPFILACIIPNSIHSAIRTPQCHPISNSPLTPFILMFILPFAFSNVIRSSQSPSFRRSIGHLNFPNAIHSASHTPRCHLLRRSLGIRQCRDCRSSR